MGGEGEFMPFFKSIVQKFKLTLIIFKLNSNIFFVICRNFIPHPITFCMLIDIHQQKILPLEVYCVWCLLMQSMPLYSNDEQLENRY